MTLLQSWYINGRHYSQTCEDWLKLQDAHASQGIAVLEADSESAGLGREEGRKVFYRWVNFEDSCRWIPHFSTSIQIPGVLHGMCRAFRTQWRRWVSGIDIFILNTSQLTPIVDGELVITCSNERIDEKCLPVSSRTALMVYSTAETHSDISKERRALRRHWTFKWLVKIQSASQVL